MMMQPRRQSAGGAARAAQMLRHLAGGLKAQPFCRSRFGAFLKKREPRANPWKNFLTIPESITRVFGLRTILRFDIVHFNETRFHCKNSVRGRAEWQADEHRLESTERSFSCVRDRVLMGLRTARPAAMPGGLLFSRRAPESCYSKRRRRHPAARVKGVPHERVLPLAPSPPPCCLRAPPFSTAARSSPAPPGRSRRAAKRRPRRSSASEVREAHVRKDDAPAIVRYYTEVVSFTSRDGAKAEARLPEKNEGEARGRPGEPDQNPLPPRRSERGRARPREHARHSGRPSHHRRPCASRLRRPLDGREAFVSAFANVLPDKRAGCSAGPDSQILMRRF